MKKREKLEISKIRWVPDEPLEESLEEISSYAMQGSFPTRLSVIKFTKEMFEDEEDPIVARKVKITITVEEIDK